MEVIAHAPVVQRTSDEILDSFIVRERDIHLHLPNGVGRTKLSNAYFDAKLGTVSTMRNWRTVLALADLAFA